LSGTISSYTIGGTTTISTGITPGAMATVVNYGAIAYQGSLGHPASGTGVQFNGGGLITNALGGTIGGYTGIGASNVVATVVNAGSIGGAVSLFPSQGFSGTALGISLGAGGLVTNVAGGTIYGYRRGIIADGAATVVNAGRIGSQGEKSTGILLQAGGLVYNQAGGVINSDALPFLAFSAVAAYNDPATVINAGTISSILGMPPDSVNLPGSGNGVYLDAGGSVTNVAGGLIRGSDNGVRVNGEAATVVNAGSISDPVVGVYIGHGGTVTNQSGGTITTSVYRYQNAVAVLFAPGYTSRLAVDPGAVFVGSLDGGNTVGAAAVSTLELAAGASLSGSLYALGAQFTNFGSIAFDTGADWFIAGDTSSLAGTIGGFAPGDTIEVTGITVTGSSYAGGVLTLDETSGSTTLHILGGFDTSNFLVTNVSDGADISVECFCTGTRILTPRGEVAVEELCIGDRVETVAGEGSAPITWIGRRTVDCAGHPEPQRVWPVRVGAGAFAAGVPCRDLFLSPDHAVYANEVLIPVKHLVNGSSIVQVPMDKVSYYHVELAQHDVLWAEGLPTESYLDISDRSNFANGGETMRLFPDFSSHVHDVGLFWEAYGFAPLVVTGPVLEAVRRHVNVRAEMLAQQEAAIRLVA
jgi:hypothetical protein